MRLELHPDIYDGDIVILVSPAGRAEWVAAYTVDRDLVWAGGTMAEVVIQTVIEEVALHATTY